MEVNDLEKYLKMVFDLETDDYIYSQIQGSIETEISSLKAPQKQEFKAPKIDNPKDLAFGFAVFGAIPGAILGFIAYGINQGSRNWLDSVLGFFVFLIVGALDFGLICAAISYPFIRIKTKKEYRKKMDSYNKNVAIAESKYNEEKQKYDQNRMLLKTELEDVKKQKKKNTELLEKMYRAGILGEKYRNLVMVASLYEYISYRRCYTLEGPDGAYNLLELERRMDKIIDNLDKILVNLNQIRDNQYVLYTSLKKSNAQLSQFISENHSINSKLKAKNLSTFELNYKLTELQASSKLMAYYAERSLKEMDYYNKMNYLANKYNNAGFRLTLPPSI